jgi:hypothetical protein
VNELPLSLDLSLFAVCSHIHTNYGAKTLRVSLPFLEISAMSNISQFEDYINATVERENLHH